MEIDLLPQKAIHLVEARFGSQEGSHDWNHMLRVMHGADQIARLSEADRTRTAWIALMHDWEDRKLLPDPRNTLEVLHEFVEKEEAAVIAEEVGRISFSKGLVPYTLEGRVVSDADRLDAIGAIGIARCFAFGGSRERALWDGVSASSLTSLGHFWEKLLKLNETLYTDAARDFSRRRQKFLHEFLLEFSREWFEFLPRKELAGNFDGEFS